MLQVCAGAAVEPQRGARRRGDGLQPLPQPRHGGQAEEARHRVHQVNSRVVHISYSAAQETHHHPCLQHAQGCASSAGGLGLPPGDDGGGPRQGEEVHQGAGAAGRHCK